MAIRVSGFNHTCVTVADIGAALPFPAGTAHVGLDVDDSDTAVAMAEGLPIAFPEKMS